MLEFDFENKINYVRKKNIYLVIFVYTYSF